MMRYDYDYDMMGGYGVLALLLWIVIFSDLILLGFWLWQRINKK